jgi:site-specific recombinase XerD
MNIRLSQAIEGFTLARLVSGCSDYTIRNYRLDLQRFATSLAGDPHLPDITANDVRDFLHQLQTTRLESPGVAPRPARIPSPKTVRNAHTTLSSLWSWAVEEGYAGGAVVRTDRTW